MPSACDADGIAEDMEEGLADASVPFLTSRCVVIGARTPDVSRSLLPSNDHCKLTRVSTVYRVRHVHVCTLPAVW